MSKCCPSAAGERELKWMPFSFQHQGSLFWAPKNLGPGQDPGGWVGRLRCYSELDPGPSPSENVEILGWHMGGGSSWAAWKGPDFERPDSRGLSEEGTGQNAQEPGPTSKSSPRTCLDPLEVLTNTISCCCSPFPRPRSQPGFRGQCSTGDNSLSPQQPWEGGPGMVPILQMGK